MSQETANSVELCQFGDAKCTAVLFGQPGIRLVAVDESFGLGIEVDATIGTVGDFT